MPMGRISIANPKKMPLANKKIQERIEGPVLDGVSYLSAIVTGIRTFIQRVRA